MSGERGKKAAEKKQTDVVALSDAERSHANGYPGVVARVGDALRVVVLTDGRSYGLQECRPGPDGSPVWAGRQRRRSLSEFLAAYGPKVPGLAEAVRGLPERPQQAAQGMVERRRLLARAYEARRTHRPDYARFVAQDGNIRVVGSLCGREYHVQAARISEYRRGDVTLWHTCFNGQTMTEVERFLLSPLVLMVPDLPMGEDGVFDDGDREVKPLPDQRLKRKRDLLRELCDWPERASEVDWPPVPEIVESDGSASEAP